MPARARHDEQRIARRWAICAIASRSSEAIYATAAVSDDALLEGCVAYFLIHALPAGGSLAEEERLLAQNFADAARIVYLGALVDAAEDGPTTWRAVWRSAACCADRASRRSSSGRRS